jgi:hypothetical protein
MPKPPFQILYSNDTTNILTCVSPYHREGEPFRPEMLAGTVDETAGTGVEVHLLQPGLGRVFLWQSQIYPPAEHYRWLKETYGLDPDEYGKYLLAGGDIVKDFIARCRRQGIVPFISMRQNDGHGLHLVDVGPEDAVCPGMSGITISRSYHEHPEWRLGTPPTDRGGWVWNFAIPEVRADRLAQVRELCENYDLDGFELDFMRHPAYFRLAETTSQQRADIMADYVGQVRSILDRTARPGQHRWLCVRVPAFLKTYDTLGIDPRRWAEAGVEMFNLSHYFFTEQNGDYEQIKQMLPGAAVYLEMTHTTRVGPRIRSETTETKLDTFSYRRTTDNQFYTAAHLAYARGFDGISAFNFVYYREHGEGERGPFNEPPFKVLNHLGDPKWLARQPQHYILSEVWNEPPLDRPLPKTLAPGEAATFTLNLAAPAGGWQGTGRLRVQAKEDLGDSCWQARLDGLLLVETSDRSEPYANPYPPLRGTVGQHRAWAVPVGLLKEGQNVLEVTLLNGIAAAEIIFVDLAV